MIVPEFKLKQNEGFVLVYIRVPYIKVTACEFYIEGDTFKFYLKPYLLSLSFQHPLQQAEQPAKAIYYHQKYILQVHLQKKNPGEHFTNLQLLGDVVNNKKKKTKVVSLVQVVDSQGVVVVEDQKNESNSFNYGFGLNYHNVMENLAEETAQLFQFDPKSTCLSDRLQLSNEILIKQFDYDSYLFDKYENQDEIADLLKDKTSYNYLSSKLNKQQEVSINPIQFKAKFHNKEILISKKLETNVIKQISSICFSYLYELICMRGDFGQQSAKTINRTSLVLSCSFYYSDMPVRDVIINCFKRCLTFSLYKSLKICHLALKYLKQCLNTKSMISCLQDIRSLFQASQPRYLLNKLFIDDYLLYLYSDKVQKENLELTISQLQKIDIKEEDLELKIKQYEELLNNDSQSQQSGQEKEKETKKLVEQFSKLDTLD